MTWRCLLGTADCLRHQSRMSSHCRLHADETGVGRTVPAAACRAGRWHGSDCFQSFLWLLSKQEGIHGMVRSSVVVWVIVGIGINSEVCVPRRGYNFKTLFYSLCTCHQSLVLARFLNFLRILPISPFSSTSSKSLINILKWQVPNHCNLHPNLEATLFL